MKDNKHTTEGFDYKKSIEDVNIGINITSEILLKKLDDENKFFWTYWMSIVPYKLFDQLFISDSLIKVPVFKDADNNASYAPVYVTQAFVLYYLETLIQNDKKFSSKFNIKSSDIEDICNIIYSKENNPVLRYLEHFRDILSKSDPRDRIIKYIYIIGYLYIRKEKPNSSMSKWDIDCFIKMELIGWFPIYIIASKEECLDGTYMKYFRKEN